MKKTLSSFLVLILMTIAFLPACNKDNNDNNSLPTTPEAKAEHDSKSGGVYKGVLIGSSGIVKIVLQDGVLQVIITIDGETRTLATTGLSSWTSGQAITNVTFSNGNWSVQFSVNNDGSNPTLAPNIAGHANMVIAILKESSTQQIKLYEGTFTGNGVTAPANKWNFISNETQLYGIHSYNPTVATVTGTRNGNNVSGTTSGGASFTGTFSGDNVSGTWTSSTNNGNWSGVRKL